MKSVLALLALALVIASCSPKGDIAGQMKYASEVTFSPVFPDGTQMYSTDGGTSWAYVPSLKKLSGCSCDCSMSARGTYPGTCTYGGLDYTCQDWCTYGGSR